MGLAYRYYKACVPAGRSEMIEGRRTRGDPQQAIEMSKSKIRGLLAYFANHEPRQQAERDDK